MELLWTEAPGALEFIRPTGDFPDRASSRRSAGREFRARIAHAVSEGTMLDIAMIAIGFVFLGGAILYVYGCDRL